MRIITLLVLLGLALPPVLAQAAPTAVPSPVPQKSSRFSGRLKSGGHGPVISPFSAKGPKSAVSPSSAISVSQPQAGFELQQQGQKLFLVFRSKDPGLTLNPKGGLVIQLNTRSPVDIEPGVITGSEWPKSGDRLELKVRGLPAGKSAAISGKASFQVCRSSTKKCERRSVAVSANFKP